MPLPINDTIVALATAPGPGARAIVRVSGPRSAALVARLGSFSRELLPARRGIVDARLTLPGLNGALPADVYIWPAPHTYTGDEMVEIHTLSSPPLVELLVAGLLQAGARAAGPGEFTMRAFLSGKLDLTRAEAVLGVIEAANPAQLRQALAQLAGGVGRPMQKLREDLLDLLADVEAGLDFTDEDIRFVNEEELLKRIGNGLAQLTILHRQLDQRGVSDRPFRVVLAGLPNAGKSSLFNALASAHALVSPEPGTTRDYLVKRLDLDGCPVDLIDTAGLGPHANTIEETAQQLGREQAHQADLILLCLEGGRADSDMQSTFPTQSAADVLAVATKSDQERPTAGLHATSAATGQGIEELRTLLRDRAHQHAQPPLAPSLSRCRHHVQACLERLRRAHAIVLYQDPPELLALELRDTLQHLGEMVGAVYTDDLLDRLFSRFCIGK